MTTNSTDFYVPNLYIDGDPPLYKAGPGYFFTADHWGQAIELIRQATESSGHQKESLTRTLLCLGASAMPSLLKAGSDPRGNQPLVQLSFQDLAAEFNYSGPQSIPALRTLSVNSGRDTLHIMYAAEPDKATIFGAIRAGKVSSNGEDWRKIATAKDKLVRHQQLLNMFVCRAVQAYFINNRTPHKNATQYTQK